jgi:hypothetical protein
MEEAEESGEFEVVGRWGQMDGRKGAKGINAERRGKKKNAIRCNGHDGAKVAGRGFDKMPSQEHKLLGPKYRWGMEDGREPRRLSFASKGAVDACHTLTSNLIY